MSFFFFKLFYFFYNNTSYHTMFPSLFSLFLPSLPSVCSFQSFLYFTFIDMACLQTRAQYCAAREASSSPVRSAARRAQIVSSVCPRAHRAKSPPAVCVASGREAEPAAKPAAEPVADPSSLCHLLCLRCAKYAVVDLAFSCFFDKEKSKKYFYCRSQKSKCFPVSTFLPRLATVRSGPDRGLFWRLLKRPDCTVQSFVGLDWTVPKDRTVRR